MRKDQSAHLLTANVYLVRMKIMRKNESCYYFKLSVLLTLDDSVMEKEIRSTGEDKKRSGKS